MYTSYIYRFPEHLFYIQVSCTPILYMYRFPEHLIYIQVSCTSFLYTGILYISSILHLVSYQGCIFSFEIIFFPTVVPFLRFTRITAETSKKFAAAGGGGGLGCKAPTSENF